MNWLKTSGANFLFWVVVGLFLILLFNLFYGWRP